MKPTRLLFLTAAALVSAAPVLAQSYDVSALTPIAGYGTQAATLSAGAATNTGGTGVSGSTYNNGPTVKQYVGRNQAQFAATGNQTGSFGMGNLNLGATSTCGLAPVFGYGAASYSPGYYGNPWVLGAGIAKQAAGLYWTGAAGAVTNSGNSSPITSGTSITGITQPSSPVNTTDPNSGF